MEATLVIFKPIADRVLVRPVVKDRTESGILLPDSAQEKPIEGTVIAVGPGKWENAYRCPPTVSEGDRCLFSKYSGAEVKINDEELLIIREDDIYGIFG